MGNIFRAFKTVMVDGSKRGDDEQQRADHATRDDDRIGSVRGAHERRAAWTSWTRTATTMSTVAVDNVGSAARDFCMLERNALSHFRLSLLLSLLASSVLLRVRLPTPETDNNDEYDSKLAVPLASLLFGCSLAVLVAGLLEYFSGQTDLRTMRPFLKTKRSGILHLV